MTLIDEHAEISRRLIRQADDEFQKGDTLQASEKAWGGAAHALKSIAEQRGWRHGRHRDIFPVIKRIVEETGQSEISLMFDAANTLHANFYENWLPDDMVEDKIAAVKDLLARIEPLYTYAAADQNTEAQD